MALLTAAEVKALTEPGRYSDGEGLHLFIRKSGTKAWVHRVTVDGRRRARGHGIAPVRRGHPAFEYMVDRDNDGVVCE